MEPSTLEILAGEKVIGLIFDAREVFSEHVIPSRALRLKKPAVVVSSVVSGVLSQEGIDFLSKTHADELVSIRNIVGNVKHLEFELTGGQVTLCKRKSLGRQTVDLFDETGSPIPGHIL
ncbi:MAG: hypothetical protein WCK51_03805 [Armatimonadota bacterium]